MQQPAHHCPNWQLLLMRWHWRRHNTQQSVNASRVASGMHSAPGCRRCTCQSPPWWPPRRTGRQPPPPPAPCPAHNQTKADGWSTGAALRSSRAIWVGSRCRRLHLALRLFCNSSIRHRRSGWIMAISIREEVFRSVLDAEKCGMGARSGPQLIACCGSGAVSTRRPTWLKKSSSPAFAATARCLDGAAAARCGRAARWREATPGALPPATRVIWSCIA